MISARASILIERPIEPVFAFVALEFFANYPRWSPQVEVLERLDPGPIRLGSRARQVRVDHGRRTDTTFTVVALEPWRHLTFEEVRQRYRIHYDFAPTGGHTRLTFACELKPLSLLLRPFETLIRGAVQEGAEQTVVAIKGLVG